MVKNCGITNLIVTTARWYGGIKLGTGGLVKAYTEAAQFALENAQTRELQLMTHLDLSLPYALLEQAKKRMTELNFEIAQEDYADHIRITGRMPDGRVTELETYLRDLSKGSILLNKVQTILE